MHKSSCDLLARTLLVKTNSSGPGDVILDPFTGSGSTIIATEMLGRRAFSMELDPAYAGVGIDRWEAFTGEQAARVDA